MSVRVPKKLVVEVGWAVMAPGSYNAPAIFRWRKDALKFIGEHGGTIRPITGGQVEVDGEDAQTVAQVVLG